MSPDGQLIEGQPDWAYREAEARAVMALYAPLLAEIATLRARAESAERRYQDEHDIVDRIWTMLGRPSYQELNGRSIYDLIGELQARALSRIASTSDAAPVSGAIAEQRAAKGGGR